MDPEVGSLGPQVVRSIFNFPRKLHSVFCGGCTRRYPLQQGSLLSTSSPALVVSCLCGDGHLERLGVTMVFPDLILKDLEMRRGSWIIQWAPSASTRTFVTGAEEGLVQTGEQKAAWRRGRDGGDVAVSRGRPAAPRSWKRPGMGSRELPEGAQPCSYLDSSLLPARTGEG